MLSRLFRFTRTPLLALAAVIVAGFSLAPTTLADNRKHSYVEDRYESRGSYSLGFRNGFRTGFRDGRSDAWSGRAFKRGAAIRKHGDGLTPYQAGFERGYARGYNAGFESARWRSRSRWDRGHDDDYDRRRHDDDDDDEDDD